MRSPKTCSRRARVAVVSRTSGSPKEETTGRACRRRSSAGPSVTSTRRGTEGTGGASSKRSREGRTQASGRESTGGSRGSAATRVKAGAASPVYEGLEERRLGVTRARIHGGKRKPATSVATRRTSAFGRTARPAAPGLPWRGARVSPRGAAAPRPGGERVTVAGAGDPGPRPGPLEKDAGG